MNTPTDLKHWYRGCALQGLLANPKYDASVTRTRVAAIADAKACADLMMQDEPDQSGLIEAARAVVEAFDSAGTNQHFHWALQEMRDLIEDPKK